MMNEYDEYTGYLKRQHWSKCSFCGATNGLFEAKLMHHRPRCTFVGAANDFSCPRPSNSEVLDEDDKRYLVMLRSVKELELAKKKISKLENKLSHLGIELE